MPHAAMMRLGTAIARLIPSCASADEPMLINSRMGTKPENTDRTASTTSGTSMTSGASWACSAFLLRAAPQKATK